MLNISDHYHSSLIVNFGNDNTDSLFNIGKNQFSNKSFSLGGLLGGLKSQDKTDIASVSKQIQEINELSSGIGNFNTAYNYSNIAYSNMVENLDGKVSPALLNYLQNTELAAVNTQSMAKAIEESNKTTSLFGGSLSNLSGMLKTAAINFGVMFVASQGISLLLKGADYILNYEDKLKEKAQDSVTEYQELKSSVENINSELEENNKQITALKAKGSLTYVEQSELEKLEKANAQLERQLKLKESEVKDKALETAQDVSDSLTGYVGIGKGNTVEDYLKKFKDGTYSESAIDDKNLAGQVALYKKYSEVMAETAETSKEWQEANDKVAESEKNINEGLDEILTGMNDMQDGYDLVMEKVEDKGEKSLTSAEKEIKQSYEHYKGMYDDIIKEMDSNEYMSYKLDEIFNTADIEKTKKELVDLYKEANGKIDYNQFPNLSKAMDEAGVSAKDLNKELEALANNPEELTDFSNEIQVLSAAIDSVADNIEAFNTAIDEMNSSTGMTSESIAAIEKRFMALDDYDATTLFENTANGVRLNQEELRKLNAEYDSNQLKQYNGTLTDMNKRYADLCIEIANTTDAQEKIKLINTRDSLKGQITQVEQLKVQYEGLTSAWSKWETALSSANSGDNYVSYYENLEKLQKLYEDHDWGTDDFQTAVKLMTNISDEAFSKLSANDIADIYKSKIGTVKQYLTEGTDGLQNFLEKLHSINKEWASQDSEGNWTIDISDVDDVAKSLDLDAELVEQIFRRLQDKGFEINFDDTVNEKLQTLRDTANEAQKSLENISKNNDGIAETFNKINIDDENVDTLEEIERQLKNVEDLKNQIVNTEFINEEDRQSAMEAAENMQNYLLAKKGELTNDVEITWNIDTTIDELNECEEKLKDLKILGDGVEIDFTPTSLKEADKEIEKITDALDKFKDSDRNIDLSVDGATEAVTILSNLIKSKEELNNPVIMNVDASRLTGDMQDAVSKIQEYQDAVNDLSTIQQLNTEYNLKLDTSQAEQNVSSALKNIQGIDKTILTELQIDPSSQEKLNSSLKSMKTEVMVKAGIDESAIKGYKPENKDAKVTYSVDKSKVDNFKNKNHNISATITYSYKTSGSKPTVSVKENSVNGTAHFGGTAHVKGTAHAQGNWGIPYNQESLVNEVDEEIIVRDGKWFTVNNGYPTYTHLKKGDVVFNGAQTKELKEKGYVTNSHARIVGSGNFAKGTAHAQGTAFVTGSGSLKKKTSSSKKNSSKKSSSSKSSSSKSSSSSANDSFEETFDWVERALNLVDKIVDRLSTAIKNVYTDWSTRNKNVSDEIGQLGAQLNYYQSAYNTYMNKANSIPLASNYKAMVQSGNWSIQDITDETLADQIKEYEKWYDLAEDCATKLEDIRQSIGDAYKQAFDNVAQEYEDKITDLENTIENLSNKSDLSKYTERTGNVSYLENQIDLYKDITNQLENEISALEKKLQEAVNSGYVKKYSEGWYEMYNTISELNNKLIETQTNISEVYKNIFDKLNDSFDNEVKYIEDISNRIEKAVEVAEAQGKLASSSYYSYLSSLENEVLDKLVEEQKALEDSLQKGIDDGTIAVFSDEWYELQSSIDDVKEAISDSEKSLAEFNQQVQECNWEVFDYLEDRISTITSEADFLIDLLENSILFDDKGNFTNEGLSTLGLHGVNYNTYMSQADDYADAIKQLDKAYKNDSLNTDYIKRREELVELQQKSILNAEKEKEAIVDLISDGYAAQLDALKELIDAKKELLNNEKDYYEFEKEIAEKTKQVAQIQKQLDAYNHDNSEETKKTVQELKVQLEEAKDDLQETEYDKYISDQEAILDNLVDEYELWINERLDHVDELISSVIDTVNENASIIGDTLQQTADKVGYDLSESMTTIFDVNLGENSVVVNALSTYNENFTNKMTTMQIALDNINTYVKSLQAIAEAEAEKKRQEEEAARKKAEEEAARQEAIKKQQEAEKQQSSNQQNTNQNSNSTKTPTSSNTNFFVYKKDSYNKSKLNKENSIVDRLKYFDFDASFSQRRNYYQAMGLGSAGSYTGSSSQNIAMIQWMKSHGYSKGGTVGKLINSSGEDGFILARTGEEVLSLDKLNTVLRIVNGLTDLGNLKVKGVTNSNTSKVTFDNVDINITLPSVTNYDDFKAALIKDNKFEKTIMTMVNTNLMGGNSLSKMKYR